VRAVASLEFAKVLIVNEKIDAQLQVNGRDARRMDGGGLRTMARDAQALQRDLGYGGRRVEQGRCPPEVAADCYRGGLLFHAHGGVHPALFHQGLLQRARTAGAFVAGHTPVTAVRREAAKFIVETARGKVDATAVIATTNGYTGRTRRHSPAVSSHYRASSSPRNQWEQIAFAA